LIGCSVSLFAVKNMMKRILFIGVGRWGANHLRVLKSIVGCSNPPATCSPALDEIAANPIRNRRIDD
jgi:hypothetical protein